MKEYRLKAGLTAFLFSGLLGPAIVFAQLPPAASLLPPGFKLTGDHNIGGSSIFIDAKKNNDNFPKPHADQGIGLRITWTSNPVSKETLQMVMEAPEEPARRGPGSATRDEPCGKGAHNGGFYTCRRVIIPWIGGGKGPDLVTYRVNWGDAGGAMGVEVNSFYGGKEGAIGIIDAVVAKLRKK